MVYTILFAHVVMCLSWDINMMRVMLLWCRFGAKEDYMFFMNDFVEQQIPNMKQFIKSISVSCVVPILDWALCTHTVKL